jgi:steroid delta-isomerase-like uncharacterized protein
MAETADAVRKQHRAIQEQDWDALAKLYSADATYRDPEVELQGREAIAERARALEAPFSGASYEVVSLLADGARAALEWRYQATNHGRILLPSGTELPATAKDVDLRGISIFDFEDGRITAQRSYWDSFSLYHQLGLAFEPGLSGSW